VAETLAHMSHSSKTEDLHEEPSLAEAAVAGAGVAQPAATEVVDPAEPSAELSAIAWDLVRSARSRDVAMADPGGRLMALTKTVIETALDRGSPTPRLRAARSVRPRERNP
jgi:hypothetical protein